MGMCASKSHACMLCTNGMVQYLNRALYVITIYEIELKFELIIVEISKGHDPLIKRLGTRPRDRGTPPGLRLACNAPGLKPC